MNNETRTTSELLTFAQPPDNLIIYNLEKEDLS
jgi:hypothetical protein